MQETVLGQSAVEQSFHLGRVIPNNRIFPEVEHLSFMSETAYVRYTNGKNNLWPSLYNFPILSMSFAYESIGNKTKLGTAFSITPTMSFYLFQKQKINLQLETGIGVAVLGKHFNKINNPDNSINGSLFNFSGMMSLLLEIKINEQFRLITGPSLSHYSNGNYANPNVGSNIPDWQLGVRYVPRISENVAEKITTAELPVINKRIHPFLRIASGLKEKGFDGPKYTVVSAAVGVNRMFGRTHRVSTGFGFILDNATLRYQKHIGLNPGEEFRHSSKYVWFVGHEFLFGYIGLLTEGGFYLNDFEDKTSFLASKLGFNFYPANAFKKWKHLPYFGFYIQSSFGEAEYVELVVGYQF